MVWIIMIILHTSNAFAKLSYRYPLPLSDSSWWLGVICVCIVVGSLVFVSTCVFICDGWRNPGKFFFALAIFPVILEFFMNSCKWLGNMDQW